MDSLSDVGVKLVKKRRKPLSKDPNPKWFWAEMGLITEVARLKAQNPKWGPKRLSVECRVNEKKCKNVLENYIFEEETCSLFRRSREVGEGHRRCLDQDDIISKLRENHGLDHRKVDSLYESLRKSYFPIVRDTLITLFKTEVPYSSLSKDEREFLECAHLDVEEDNQEVTDLEDELPSTEIKDGRHAADDVTVEEGCRPEVTMSHKEPAMKDNLSTAVERMAADPYPLNDEQMRSPMSMPTLSPAVVQCSLSEQNDPSSNPICHDNEEESPMPSGLVFDPEAEPEEHEFSQSVSEYYRGMYKGRFSDPVTKTTDKENQEPPRKKAACQLIQRQNLHRQMYPLEQFATNLQDEVIFYPNVGEAVYYRLNPALSAGTAFLQTGFYRPGVCMEITKKQSGTTYKIRDSRTDMCHVVNRCSACNCNSAGSFNHTCSPSNGQCFCKPFTKSRQCDKCITDTSGLEETNPYGCSKAPNQQPPPSHEPLSSTAIRLTWREPDFVNGVLEQYRVIRNDTVIFVLSGDARTADDTDLQPFTVYSYVLEATNGYGSEQSAPISFRTPAGPPYGTIVLNASDIRAKSVMLSWNEPQIMNGPLDQYILYSETERNDTRIYQWHGQDLEVTLTTLVPFTNYIFHVDACTSGGCLTSLPVLFTTMSAVPEGIYAPVILALNNTALHVSWEPPAYPNGIIIFYELWMRGGLEFDGTRNPSETRIFHPGGQYNPRPTQYPQENALPPPDTEYILTGLKPFTLYEFQVVAENSAGKSASPWAAGRTGATFPSFTPAPHLISLSPFSLNVTWEAPSPNQARGVIILYRVYYYQKTIPVEDLVVDQYTWRLLHETTQENGYHILRGLSPYTKHTVMVEACNMVGCMNSTPAVGRTQQDAPEGLPKPFITGLNASVMEITWIPPAFPNGPVPLYTIQKTTPALSFPPQVISGTRFPGGGYYLFPPDTIPQNVEFTGIRFWFRTRKRDGLLLFAASEGRQQEFVALHIKAGRPWFLFDPQGCASYASPTNDEGLIYNNNIWHHIVAWRDENVAYISVDGKWAGNRKSQCSSGNIIGPNTGVYIGGLPPDFEIRRNPSDQRLQVKTTSYQGCIRDVQIMQRKYPTEVWKTLEWDQAIHNELAFLNWEGCPVNLDKGVHFMGQGYARFPSKKLQLGHSKLIEFSFRTQMHTGILLFVYGGTGIYMYCALVKGVLHFEFANGLSKGSVIFNQTDVNFCDSQWYSIDLIKTGEKATISVRRQEGRTLVYIGEETSGDASVSLDVLTSSDLYVGGIPLESEAHQFVIDNNIDMPIAAFGGCMHDITFDKFSSLDFLEEIIEVVNMNMDGCTPYHSFEETCMDDLITDVFNGTDMITYDRGLQPYTDYLYRVMATNDAGSGTSLWGYGRTKEGAPVGVTAPYESYSFSGYLVEFKWHPPVSTSGLLTNFVLKAYNLDNPLLPPVETLITNTSKTTGNMSDTTPFTEYKVRMVACTSGGCSESPDGLVIHTVQEAPRLVPAPKGFAGTSHISISWDPPSAPNGLITGYFLYMDDAEIYTGGGTAFNVSIDLQVYTTYVFYLKACTAVGCTEGPSSSISSAQRPPKFVKAPVLIALGTSTVEVRWEPPQQLNGILERYMLYASTVDGQLGQLVYNNSDFFLDYTMHWLVAGTTYYITLAACTGGGCTLSEPSNIATDESAPSDIKPPTVISPAPNELFVSWTIPGLTNGEITRYDLFHNEVPIYSGMKMEYSVGGLQPFSLHAFRVVACTRRGCGSSSLTQGRTMEAQPEGFVTMNSKIEDTRTVSVKWSVPEKPNGDMYFDVYFEGLFYTDPDNWDYNTYYDRQSLYRSQTENEWVTIFPLIPLSSYNVQVNASNSVGFILSNSMSLDMPPGSPDGVKPPSLVSKTPTTITAIWNPVGRHNSADEAMFILQFRKMSPDAIILDIFGPTASFLYVAENLIPFNEYEFRLIAKNSNGNTRSSWVTMTTRQGSPAGFLAPLVVGKGQRYIDFVWEKPMSSNGILDVYKIYQNGRYRQSTSVNVTMLRADNLIPYKNYTFIIEACTAGGCTRSPPSRPVLTSEDAPEQVEAPTAVSVTPAAVELSWRLPGLPNGVISLYTIERRPARKMVVTAVVSITANEQLKYVDDDSTLAPYAEFEYRLIAVNRAGEGFSPWTYVRLLSSRPAGLRPPKVIILGPTLMSVSWEEPLQPNGRIEFYTVRLPEPRMEVRNTSQMSVLFPDLTAYTEYSVTVTACTDGGCTESVPVNVTTTATVPERLDSPLATPLSQTMITVSWQEPELPNGPDIIFELSRMFIRQPLDPAVNESDSIWVTLYRGMDTFLADKGLPMFSFYRYRVTVFNTVGQLTSEPTDDVSTYGGVPTKAAVINATALSHRTIKVSWETPNEVELQGSVKEYRVQLQSHLQNYTDTFGLTETSTTFDDLQPNTQYTVLVTITIHGGAYITSDPVYVTTLDGAPEGVDSPALNVVSKTAIRVSWIAPKKPKGQIIGYYLYKNGEHIDTGLVATGSYVLSGLQPYTVYQIQLEVCSEFGCVQSEKVLGATLEAAPQAVGVPLTTPLSPHQIKITWQAPLNPNGIIRRYELWRRTIKQCSKIHRGSLNENMSKCEYIQCQVDEQLCGTVCYTSPKVCCGSVLHDSQAGYECCGMNYALISNSSDVCCDGKFYSYRPDYKCCNTRYELVLPDEVCCHDSEEDRITVGRGDQCCDVIPFSSNASQICCNGQLYERFGHQCCGGEMVPDTQVCCGDEETGHAYSPRDYMTCCGQQYVREDTTLCCISDEGHVKVHKYASPQAKEAANQKCCGIETVSKGLSCCNYVGYNPGTQFCADTSLDETSCGSATVCLLAMQDTAFCDRCDFDPYTYTCWSAKSSDHTKNLNSTSALSGWSDYCVDEEDLIYKGTDTNLIDNNLTAYSLYDYAVSVVNSAGTTKSDFTRIQTLQARPEGLDPPKADLDPQQLYMIFMRWKPPKQPNGEILKFALFRDGTELYHGLDHVYTDDTNILPYKSYVYTLTACTIAGCTESSSITVATAQAAPEGVHIPSLTAEDSRTLNLTWFPPDVMNGIITDYRVHVWGIDFNDIYRTRDLSIVISDLAPYSVYHSILIVCTEAACTNSSQVSILMPEAAPQGVFAPKIIIRNSTTVDIYWTPALQPNGQVILHELIREGRTNQVFAFPPGDLHSIDSGLTPGRTYTYSIMMGTKAGNTSSNSTSVTMPDSTPSNISAPSNVTVLSATEIYVGWDPIPPENGKVDQYRVLLNAGRHPAVDRGVGLNTNVTVTGLQPYTQYEVRIQACLEGVPNGCGTGPGVIVKTLEAAPSFMDKPLVDAKGPFYVEVIWNPPKYPNGIITQYLVYFRNIGSDVQQLVNRVTNDTLKLIHSRSGLVPYTEYEYRVIAINSQGEASSPWTLVRTNAAPPLGLSDPLVTVLGAFSVEVKWSQPVETNGAITKYKIMYKKAAPDPTVDRKILGVTINGNVTTTFISGLHPYSEYHLCIQAFNLAGNTSSKWTAFKTKESSPSGLGLFEVEKLTSGQAVILRWDVPEMPNGIITTYHIFETGSNVAVFQGLNREFEMRRLEPYKEYSVELEACTAAGCTRSRSQTFYTAETTPTGQAAPTLSEATASSVIISWVQPTNPNGKITMYEILRRTNTRIKKREISEAVVVYRTTDTDLTEYSYTDTMLRPFTEYQYSIKASNSKGYTLGPWQSVFTTQAPPEGVQPPLVKYVTDQLDALQITWSTPDHANGILQSYQIKRNDSVLLNVAVDNIESYQYIDTGLKPYTIYSYTLTACSEGGCTDSDPVIVRTKETAPFSVPKPSIKVINSTSIQAFWQKPQVVTGEIIAYQLHMNDTAMYEGLDEHYVVTNLTAFTSYGFKVAACTIAGCTESVEATGKTDDDIPENISPPVLNVLSANSIAVSWSAPEHPNGIITSYDITRDGKLIFTESLHVTGSLKTKYTDYNLQPGTEYVYILTASNRKGSLDSNPSIAVTFSSSPDGLDPPAVHPLSSTSVQVTWTIPTRTNGIITNYTVFKDGEIVCNVKPFQFSCVVAGLQFWTEYSFQVEACTDRGCTVGPVSKAWTLPAKPGKQGRPRLLALADQNGAHAGVLINWEPPLQPNGVIIRYEVYRRIVIDLSTGVAHGPVRSVYNGSDVTYTDTDTNLLPFREYLYSVTAVNSVGKVSSDWEIVMTKEAPPTSVPAPSISSITSSLISATIKPPTKPNGIVRYYSVYVNDTVVSRSLDLNIAVGQNVPLQPFTFYTIRVEACTAGGCTSSPTVIVQTSAKPPAGQEPVRAVEINSTAVRLVWKYPLSPNGKITKFVIYKRTACPKTSQLFEQSCMVGDTQNVFDGLFTETLISGLVPYTAYDFQVQSVNEAGPVNFPVWIRIDTSSDKPKYVQHPELRRNNSKAIVDWSESFQLNSKLLNSEVIVEDTVLYSGTARVFGVQRSSAWERLYFKVRIMTETGIAESPTLVFDPKAKDNIGTTPHTVISGESPARAVLPFYQEVWFLTLMVLTGVFLLLVLLACCVYKWDKYQRHIRERLPMEFSQIKKPMTFSKKSIAKDLVAMDEPPWNTTENSSEVDGVINPAFSITHVNRINNLEKALDFAESEEQDIEDPEGGLDDVNNAGNKHAHRATGSNEEKILKDTRL